MNAFDAPRALQRPQLRYYQDEAVEAVMKSFEGKRSTLVVKATGLGKSVLFSEVASRFLDKGRVLCLAHRKELVTQAAMHIQRATGEQVDVEMAEEWSSIRSNVISASVPTLCQERRLTRFAPDHFALVIADEAHHYTSKSFRKILDYFTGAKILGVTATPDRGDEKALGQVFEDVAYVMDIVDGIQAGYLVPIVGKAVQVDEIDVSQVSTTAGDLAIGELDEAMVQAVEGVVQKALELGGDRQGVWFWPGVKSAELACDRLNALKPGSAAFVCGETPKEERDEIVNQYKRGNTQHLVNCAVFVEGFDAPATSMIVMAHPTKSRAAYAQRCGRGTRILPGVVEPFEGKELAAARRNAIAASAKPHLLLLDFYGNSGRHALVTPEDLLGGDYTEEEVKLAKKAAKEGVDGDVLAGLEAARKELKAMMAKLQSKVKATVQTFDPFSILRMEAPDASKERFREPMTQAQTEKLATYNIKPKQMEGLSKLEAQKLIGTLQVRRNHGLCSLNQLAALRKYCDPITNLPFRQASQAMTYLAETCGWNPTPEQKSVLQGMVVKR